MNQVLARCPNPVCACPVRPEDAFCAHCGRALGQPVPGKEVPSESAAPQSEPGQVSDLPALLLAKLEASASRASADPMRATARLTGSNWSADIPVPPGRVEQPPTPFSSLTADTSVRAPAETPAGALAGTECADLEVRYNNSCVFVLNMQSTFDFEIWPRAEGIRDLFVEVRQTGKTLAREIPMVRPRPGGLIAFGLNYIPRNTHPGKVSFTIVVGYRKGSEKRIYAAYRTHTLWSGKEDPRRVCENLVVEVKNNIQQGHAGDIKVDQSFQDIRDVLRQQTTIELDKEFLNLINARPFWTPLALAECGPDAVPEFGAVPEAARRSCLVLREAGGAVVHLLMQDQVRIGRARDCEIRARLHSSSGQELQEQSKRLSRYHALIEWRAGSCRLADRGYYPDERQWRPSATGLWVDGQRIPVGGDLVLAAGREYKVTLPVPTGDAAGCEFSARLWLVRDLPRSRPGCPGMNPEPDAPAALVLRRVNGPPPIYILLRQCASLGWIDPRWRDACVCARHGALHYSDGQVCGWLLPSQPLRAGEVEFQVLDPHHAG